MLIGIGKRYSTFVADKTGTFIVARITKRWICYAKPAFYELGLIVNCTYVNLFVGIFVCYWLLHGQKHLGFLSKTWDSDDMLICCCCVK
jgi:hypothetical protein